MRRVLFLLFLCLIGGIISACGDSPLANTPISPANTPTNTVSTVQIVQQVQYSTADQLIIIGTVRNTGAETLNQVRITAEIRDTSGATVATGGDSFLQFAALPPNMTAPFQIVLGNNSGSITGTVLLQARGAIPRPGLGYPLSPVAGLVAEGIHVGTPESAGTLLTGRVHNGSTTSSNNTTIFATAYDAQDHVVDVTQGFIGGINPLPAGQETPFNRYFFRQGVAIQRVDVLVMQQPQ
jgi:hypothetical protein